MSENQAKKTQENLTEGSAFKRILLFSLPLVLSNVLQVAFNMSDVAVVGQFAGSEALGSVGSTTIYVALFTGLLIGMGSGVNSLAALHIGAGNNERLSKTVHTSALVCLVFGVMIFAVGAGLSRPLLTLMNTKEELIDGAVLYVCIYFAGMPALAVYNFGNGVFSADGDTKKPLVFLTIAGVVNVGLNLFFVIVCKMAVAGVAVASVISQYLSAAMVIIALCASKRPYRLSFKKLRISRDETKKILLLGVPAGLQNAIFNTANLFIQASVNSFDTVMVEGNSAAANADALVYDVMAAIYTACSSFIAQYYGANKKNGILKCYFISLLYSFAAGAILGFSLALAGTTFLSLFTSDSAVVEAGMKRLSIMEYSYCVSAFMDCTIAASRGIGKTVVPTVVVILGSCVFRVIWIYTIFAYFHTIPSLYLLYPASWTVTAIAEIVYFVIAYRKIRKNDITSETA